MQVLRTSSFYHEKHHSPDKESSLDSFGKSRALFLAELEGGVDSSEDELQIENSFKLFPLTVLFGIVRFESPASVKVPSELILLNKWTALRRPYNLTNKLYL